MSLPGEGDRWVPATWTWEYACEVFEMTSDELRAWIDTENAGARAAGKLEPVIVDGDGHVTWVGTPS